MSSILMELELLRANRLKEYTPARLLSHDFIKSPLSIRLDGNFDVNKLRVLPRIEADQIIFGTGLDMYCR